MHQEACGRDADLAGIAELGGTGGLDGQGDVGVFADDDRGVAAQLHGHALHVLASQAGQHLADRRGAGEGDLANDRVRDQVAGDLGRIAVDQADHAGRQAGVGEGADQLGRGGRGFLGRLDQHGAAAGQRGRQLAHDLVDREVPGREGRDRADGVFHDQLAHGQVARGHDAAVDAHAFVGEPFDDVGGGHGLTLGLGQRLAVFLRQHGANRGRAFAHQRGRTAHDLGALERGHIAPDFKAFLRSDQRAVQVLDAGVGDAADFLARGGIEDSQAAAVGSVLPFAGNEELGAGIGHWEGPAGWSTRRQTPRTGDCPRFWRALAQALQATVAQATFRPLCCGAPARVRDAPSAH